MIRYKRLPDGSLFVWLQRSNDWMSVEYHFGGADGDVPVGTIPADAGKDVIDAAKIIDKIKAVLHVERDDR